MLGVVATRKRCATFLLTVSLFCALPQTVLNSPDPLWVAGAYDGGDLDDLILANAGDGLTSDILVVHIEPYPAGRLLVAADSAHFFALGHPFLGSRAPPFLY